MTERKFEVVLKTGEDDSKRSWMTTVTINMERTTVKIPDNTSESQREKILARVQGIEEQVRRQSEGFTYRGYFSSDLLYLEMKNFSRTKKISFKFEP